MRSAGEGHLKLAIGADYLDACPIRGIAPAADETMVAHAKVSLEQ